MEPATEPPDSGITLGRKGVESIVVCNTWVEVVRSGKTFLIPSANVKHVRI